MYVIHEKLLKQALADVASVSEQLSKKFLCELLVLQRFPVVHIARCEQSLYDSSFVIDDQVEFETIEPSHCALAFLSLAPHGLMVVFALDLA